ncbi:hypothetical protein FHT02_004348 [Sphingomonas xinjiangensis]|uniref:Uncharacterized protein n=1 Tax=Sphingomonas xinjiangensis TaxID=643568 RepID=A0A840YTN6_9SPHN|nr:hypothetical protein [Sphingomonas xinjiangensis]
MSKPLRPYSILAFSHVQGGGYFGAERTNAFGRCRGGI